MPRIRIHTELKAKPKITKIPPGRLHLSYSASGPGEVVERVSVSKTKPVRFMDSRKASRVLERKVMLRATAKQFSRNVQICRTKIDITEEIFTVTLTLRKVDKNGNIVDWDRTSTTCGFVSSKSAKKCPESPV